METSGKYGKIIPLFTLVLLIAQYNLILEKTEGGEISDSSIHRSSPVDITFEDLALSYPTKITIEEDHIKVHESISVSSTRRLNIGAGERILFGDGVSLDIGGLLDISGQRDQPCHMGPINSEYPWGGINIDEAREEISNIDNLTLSGASTGLFLKGSDCILDNVRISNCSNTGLDVRGPVRGDGTVVVNNLKVVNCTFYGVLLNSVGDFIVEDYETTGCSIGLRSYASSGSIMGATIKGAKNSGLYCVDSNLSIVDVSLAAGADSGKAPSYQVISTNSTVLFDRCDISGAVTDIQVLSDSELIIKNTKIHDAETDLIRIVNSTMDLEGCDLGSRGHFAFEMIRSVVNVEESRIRGSADFGRDSDYGSVYSESCKFTAESSIFGDTRSFHLYIIDTTAKLSNSSLGDFEEYAVELFLSSAITFVNTPPPRRESVFYHDSFSLVKYMVTIEVKIFDFDDGVPLGGVTVDMVDREDDKIASLLTDEDGLAGPVEVLTYINYSYNQTNFLFPIRILAQKNGYEMTLTDMTYPRTKVEIHMYPPNDPPSLILRSPTDRETVKANVLLVGIISDDLGVHMIKLKVDNGYFREYELMDVEPNGSFSLDIDLSDVYPGEHTLSIHAYDGTHLSSPSTREVILENPKLEDSDGDGLSNYIEDRNGNGIVDKNETDPENPDSDGDGLLDGIEDSNGNGIVDNNETDPLNRDTDGDFLIDGFEDSNGNGKVDPWETDPLSDDTDGDGVIDSEDRYPLNPVKWEDYSENDNGIYIIIAVLVSVILLVILLYLVLIKRGGGGNRPSGREIRGL